MERAVRLGCTEQQILEALETALTPVGSAPFPQAVAILMQVTGWQPAAARKGKRKARLRRNAHASTGSA